MSELPIQQTTPAPKKSNKIWIIVVVVLLIICCLCSLVIVGGGAGYYYLQNNNLRLEDVFGMNPPSEESSQESPADPLEESAPASPEPEKATQKPLIQLPNLSGVTLGDEVRFENCGYSFKKTPDFKYVLKGEGCSPAMVLSGSEEIYPPSILLSNTVGEGAQSLYDSQVKFVDENKDYTILSKNKTKIGGVDGNSWDMKIKQGESDLRSRMVLVMVTPNQYFQITAIGPTEKWEALLPYFEAVKNSVSFFEPK
ncbi:MAG TPA: hypothetical protein VF338_03975 [Leptolinea sp.]